jgi:hypothetical protein
MSRENSTFDVGRAAGGEIDDDVQRSALIERSFLSRARIGEERYEAEDRQASDRD